MYLLMLENIMHFGYRSAFSKNLHFYWDLDGMINNKD